MLTEEIGNDIYSLLYYNNNWNDASEILLILNEKKKWQNLSASIRQSVDVHKHAANIPDIGEWYTKFNSRSSYRLCAFHLPLASLVLSFFIFNVCKIEKEIYTVTCGNNFRGNFIMDCF